MFTIHVSYLLKILSKYFKKSDKSKEKTGTIPTEGQAYYINNGIDLSGSDL